MPETFPPDLLEAQRRLYETRAEYEALCATLPWSVDPMPGWPGEEHPHTGVVTGGRDDSPGYTEQQTAEDTRLRALLVDLSITIAAHEHWATYEGEARVKARMALKQHPDVQLEPAPA